MGSRAAHLVSDFDPITNGQGAVQFDLMANSELPNRLHIQLRQIHRIWLVRYVLDERVSFVNYANVNKT